MTPRSVLRALRLRSWLWWHGHHGFTDLTGNSFWWCSCGSTADLG